MVGIRGDPVLVKKISTIHEGRPDDIFICCASFEERCLGSLRKLSDYRANQSFLFIYSHESERRNKHLKEMRKHLSYIGNFEEVTTEEDNPITAVQHVTTRIEQQISNVSDPAISLDISTLTKRHLLLLLKILDLRGLLSHTRLIYTEPKDYITDLDQPLSFGLKKISLIPTFVGQYDPSKDLLLVIFLGYEGDRAMALLENIDPNRCIVVIPKPAYHPEWEGRTEKMNSTILRALSEENVRYADSRSPTKVAQQLEATLSEPERSLEKYNHFIAPLGTKPQTVGIYLYTTWHPDSASIIYVAPLRHNEPFLSTGIGRSWLLPLRKMEVGN